MKLSELFTIVADRAGRVLRVTLPEQHDDADLQRAQRITEQLPRIFEAPASEARTDRIDSTEMPTMQLPARTPPRPSAWFEEEKS